MKTLYISIIVVLFVSVFANIEHVFADNDSIPHHNITTTDYGGNGIMVNSNQTMAPVLPSPPLGMYPYTSKIFSVFQIDPEIVHPNDTSAIRIWVTNNAKFALYDVNLGESLNDSKFLMISNIHKIDILNPNQTKTIYGTLRVSADVQPTNYYDIWWNVVAKNQTGNMMESMQFHRNLPIAQNLPQYYSGPVVITLESPLKQFKSGIKTEDVKCVTSFQLLIKENNGQPVCVKTSTIARLVTQGWILPHTIKVANSGYSIKYGINTGTLVAAAYDTTTNSVALSVNTTNGGYFNAQLPRSFIDSKDKLGADNIWSVIMDGKDIDYTEKKTDDSRILSFSFDSNAKKIVIIPYCSSFPC